MLEVLKDRISRLRFSRFLVNADDIRTYRSALMGVAILWVMFFHGGVRLPIFVKGYIGVDIFFFLSAIGLCYSFDKNPDLWSFYKKRIFRIIPTWWIAMAVAMSIFSFVFHSNHPTNIGEVILMFSGVGYWIQGFFEPSLRVVYYEWYIPTLLLFYLAFPLIAKFKSLFLFVLIMLWEIFMWYIKFQGMLDIHSSIFRLSIPRVSIFMYGILYYRICLSSSRTYVADWVCVISLVTSFILLSNGISAWPRPNHYTILLLLPVLLKGLCVLIRTTKSFKVFSFLGGLSLELYLVHIYWNIPKFSIGDVTIPRYISYVPQVFLCIGLAIILRLCVHKLQDSFAKVFTRTTV